MLSVARGFNSHPFLRMLAHLLPRACGCSFLLCFFITYRVGIPRGPFIVLACMSGCTRMHCVFFQCRYLLETTFKIFRAEFSWNVLEVASESACQKTPNFAGSGRKIRPRRGAHPSIIAI
ncbi:unnamed protein product [Ectocarpus fasciculatus]